VIFFKINGMDGTERKGKKRWGTTNMEKGCVGSDKRRRGWTMNGEKRWGK
jgi:hypothetical protein